MLTTILLWINIVGFVAYGLFCFFFPHSAAAAMGYTLSNADAVIEISAMYGGVQIMIGLYCLLLLRSATEAANASALKVMLMVYGGLVAGRFFGLLTSNGDVGVYTEGATSFEVMMFIALAYCCIRSPLGVKSELNAIKEID
ncbi:MAG: nitrate reductase gamma subunit [Flavobacterium sp.]